MKTDTLTTDTVGWSFLRSRRWFGYYALIVVFSIVCVMLGNWQFDRRAGAQAEIARIDNNYDASPVSLEEALGDRDAFDVDRNKWQQVEMTGTYVGDPYLARNRASQQGVGSLLIHPLQLPDGSIFFVDRGWVDVVATDDVPGVLPEPATGHVEVVVRLRESESEIKGRTNEGRTLGSINLPLLAEEFSHPAYTGAYGQLVSEAPVGEAGVAPLKPERDEGPHLSYALQWYVFIIIVLCGAWYAATLEHRSLNPAAAADRLAKKDRSRARKPRRLTDAEEEDALLDG